MDASVWLLFGAMPDVIEAAFIYQNFRSRHSYAWTSCVYVSETFQIV